MTEERADYLRRCRIGLVTHAKYAKHSGVSAAAWEDEALVSEAGLAVGSQQVDAVVRLVWGIGGAPMWR